MDAMGCFNVLLWTLWTHYLTALDPHRMGTMASRLGVQLRKTSGCLKCGQALSGAAYLMIMLHHVSLNLEFLFSPFTGIRYIG
jgi:hypothetical protein